MQLQDIRIGTLVKAGAGTASYMKQIIPYGFESFSLHFWKTLGDIDLPTLANQVKEALAGSDVIISNLGAFGNPLLDDEIGSAAREMLKKCIDAAPLFGSDMVSCFTGRLTDVPIDENMDRFVEVFEPLAKQAADNGVKIAFENCAMGGDWWRGSWNIAHNPAAWEMIFNALPMDNLGLQWEPCHQLIKLVDPLPQLRKWVGKILSVHGKDATILWDVIREHGIGGPHRYAFDRTPGFGDSNWTDIISILRQGGYVGTIDIEGWHDPIYRDDLEMTGQVHALNYLKQCRGGATFVPNPA